MNTNVKTGTNSHPLDRCSGVELEAAVALLKQSGNLSEEAFFVSGFADEPDKELVCTMEIDYVCGCNGYLYANECWAMRDGNTSWVTATVETNCKN